MLLLPENDLSDLVLITTEDDIGYKLGFSLGEQKQLLRAPEKGFVAPKGAMAELSSMEWKDLC